MAPNPRPGILNNIAQSLNRLVPLVLTIVQQRSEQIPAQVSQILYSVQLSGHSGDMAAAY
jgi:hypothetical protein